MKLLGFGLSIFLLTISFPGVTQGIQLIRSGEVIQKGKQLYDSGRYAEALKVYYQIHPADTNYLLMRSEAALTLMADKQYDSAIRMVRHDLEKPSEYRAHLFKTWAISLDRSGKHKESLDVFHQAIEEFPMDHSLLFNLGITHYNQKEYREAYRCVTRALKINPYHPASHATLGKLFAFQGHKTQALMALGVYMSINTNDNANLVFIERLCNNEISDEGSIAPFEASHFERVDKLINSRIALEKGFDNKIAVNASLVKQYQLMIDQLANLNPADSNFWNWFYLPFYKHLKKTETTEAFIYHILSSTKIEAVPKWKEKNEKKLDAFFDIANEHLRSLRAMQTAPPVYGLSNPVQAWYDENRVVALGKENKNGNRLGKWIFFHSNGIVSASGNYDSNHEKIGLWQYHYSTGVKKKTEDFSTLKAEAFDVHGKLEARYGITPEGEINGTVELFSPCGQLQERLQYQNGKRHGKGQAYYLDGTRSVDYEYADDLLTGRRMSYYPNGQVKESSNYDQDLLHGLTEVFHPNGRLYITGRYERGNQVGEWFYYYENGQLEHHGKYVNGLPVGPWKYFSSRGIATEVRPFDEKGRLHGTNSFFSEKGLHYTIEYETDIPVRYTFYDPTGKKIATYGNKSGTFLIKGHLADGKLYYEGEFEKGIRKGLWKYYHDNGKVRSEVRYENGEQEGQSTDFYRSGSRKNVAQYKSGQLEGLFQEFYAHGLIRQEGFFVDGMREQVWKTYYADGTLENENFYLRDQLVGISQENLITKDLYNETDYVNGRRTSMRFYSSNRKIEVDFDLTKPGYQTVELLFPNGKARYRTSLSCGEFTDDIQYLLPDQRLWIVDPRKNGINHGTYKSYHLTGELQTQGEYMNGEKIGLWNWYYPDGKLSSSAFFQNGKQDSISTHFFDDGSVSDRIRYMDDERHGKSEIYGTGGHLLAEKMFVNGRFTEFRLSDKSGKLSAWKPVELNMVMEAYYPNGTLGFQEFFQDGLREKSYRIFSPTGMLLEEMNSTKGEYEGPYRTFYVNGKPKEQGFRKFDEIHGQVDYFHPDGSLWLTENFIFGYRNGKCVVYESNGKTREIWFRGGLPDR